MNALYIETSAVLAWLFSEENSEKIRAKLVSSENIVTSTLTAVEVGRSLWRAENEKVLSATQHQKLLGMFVNAMSSWSFSEMTETIRVRAAQNFPVEPVRTLDAIHLSTMLHCQQAFDTVEILSLDKRILLNLEPLGFTISQT